MSGMAGMLGNRKTKTKKRTWTYMVHVDNGFPHYVTKIPAFCMCLDDCCQHPEKGCICKTCPCRRGFEHGVYIDDDIDKLLARAKRLARRGYGNDAPLQHETSEE